MPTTQPTLLVYNASEEVVCVTGRNPHKIFDISIFCTLFSRLDFSLITIRSPILHTGCLGYYFNNFSMTGCCSGPARYDVSIRHAARAAFVKSSFKIFLTQTFPRCGATCYILPSRAMTRLFNVVNFVYRSVEVYLTFCSYLRVFVRIRNFYNVGRY